MLSVVGSNGHVRSVVPWILMVVDGEKTISLCLPVAVEKREEEVLVVCAVEGEKAVLTLAMQANMATTAAFTFMARLYVRCGCWGRGYAPTRRTF